MVIVRIRLEYRLHGALGASRELPRQLNAASGARRIKCQSLMIIWYVLLRKERCRVTNIRDYKRVLDAPYGH